MSSSTSDKISGFANEAVGNIKQGLGKVVGSEKLQAEGLAQEAKGEALKASGETKEKVKVAASSIADGINKHL